MTTVCNYCEIPINPRPELRWVTLKPLYGLEKPPWRSIGRVLTLVPFGNGSRGHLSRRLNSQQFPTERRRTAGAILSKNRIIRALSIRAIRIALQIGISIMRCTNTFRAGFRRSSSMRKTHSDILFFEWGSNCPCDLWKSRIIAVHYVPWWIQPWHYYYSILMRPRFSSFLRLCRSGRGNSHAVDGDETLIKFACANETAMRN